MRVRTRRFNEPEQVTPGDRPNAVVRKAIVSSTRQDRRGFSHKPENDRLIALAPKFQFRTFSGPSGEGCEVREQVTINIALCRVERHVR
jgi:hypothetical protein